MTNYEDEVLDNGVFKVLAKNGTDVVGSVFASKRGDEVVIDSIQVNPPNRRDRIAGNLFSEVESWARRGGAKKIVGNFRPDVGQEKSARKAYKKYGYSVKERKISKNL